MIQHTVAFRFGDAPDEQAFWAGVATLGVIEGVQNFQTLRQVGSKNDFSHALSMFFDSQVEYDAYNVHPDHVAFVENLWMPNVADFTELDYVVES